MKTPPVTKALEPVRDLPAFLDRLYRAPSSAAGGPRELPGSPLARYVQRVHEAEDLYLLGAGARGPDLFKSYATAVQDFDWAEFYAVSKVGNTSNGFARDCPRSPMSFS